MPLSILKATFGVSDDGSDSPLQTVLFGGLAGVACWTLSYPQDVVKSHLQLQPLSTAPPLEQIEKKLAFSRRIEQYMKILKAQGPPVRALNHLE